MKNSLRYLFKSYAPERQDGDRKAGFAIAEEDQVTAVEERRDAAAGAGVEKESFIAESVGEERGKRKREDKHVRRARKKEKKDREWQPKPAEVGHAEVDIDVDALARSFVRKEPIEEIEKRWEENRRALWSEFKSRRRDLLRNRKHGATKAAAR
mmetsp:Transcript_3279/g.10035  ORF Transcript_3279/g.10035 Transcript_3279/m.10035 type:complete len:154 (-) Transcript_3279:1215-1676(-)